MSSGKTTSTTLHGTGVSVGIARGTALVIQEPGDRPIFYREIPAKTVKQEVAKLRRAFESARKETEALFLKMRGAVGPDRARIFEAQAFMLSDDALSGEALRLIERQRVNAEWALRQTRDALILRFKGLGAEYFRDRLYDVKDVTRKVELHLEGNATASEPISRGRRGTILVTPHLSPTEAASLDHTAIEAFVIMAGGRTSHTAILAKAMGIPAVIGVKDAIPRIVTGDPLLVDGGRGRIIIRPSAEDLRSYERDERTRQKHLRLLRRERSKPGMTLDGRHIGLKANIELAEEAVTALQHGAEGVGLYRTEFLYLSNRNGIEPNEEAHYRAYREVAERIQPRSAVIRTLDLGGDKLVPEMGIDESLSSPLGLRALRLCLERPALFRVQLRAILRASAYGRIRILLPFVTTVEEVRKAKGILEQCKEELKRERTRFDKGVEVGVMIEIPSAAMTADLIAREADFLSIGTNDLIQYLMAVDRTNEAVANLYDPFHPALIRMMALVSEAGRATSTPVAVCGEIAANPLAVPLLVGMGIAELSMEAHSIPGVRYVVRHIRFDDCIKIARDTANLTSSKSVRRRLVSYLRGKVPEWLISREAPSGKRR